MSTRTEHRHLITTTPTCRACRTCNRLELVGLAEGSPYRCEPAPLTAHAELARMLAGHRTYALLAGELVHRTVHRIRGDHRGRPTVLAEHHCAHPVTATDIDSTRIYSIRPLIAVKKDPFFGKLSTDTENALFTVAAELGGRVIEDTPPF